MGIFVLVTALPEVYHHVYGRYIFHHSLCSGVKDKKSQINSASVAKDGLWAFRSEKKDVVTGV